MSTKLLICQTSIEEETIKYPLKSIQTYCQKDSNKVIKTDVYFYNSANQLIKSETYRDTLRTSYNIYNYKDSGLVISKEYYSGSPLNLDRTRIFKYNEKNKLIYEGFDDERGNNTKLTYSYSAGKLISSNGSCNYNEWEQTYEYDKKNRLIEQYKNQELELSFEYENNKLIKKTKYFRHKNYEITYKYDSNGKISTITENGKIIEEYFYRNEKLIKRLSHYFGIDPCYSQCCSQYIYKYEYYNNNQHR